MFGEGEKTKFRSCVVYFCMRLALGFLHEEEGIKSARKMLCLRLSFMLFLQRLSSGGSRVMWNLSQLTSGERHPRSVAILHDRTRY